MEKRWQNYRANIYTIYGLIIIAVNTRKIAQMFFFITVKNIALYSNNNFAM
jgi:hypothetical protein